MNEPIIIINGEVLTTGQAMTLRVALESFAFDLSQEGLGDDECGKGIQEAYLNCIKDIRTIMYAG